ncbi:hypothetical protein [Pseudoalteromonas rhizosphaerae]|uniref:hypothetical protein n=1 Tax=Pseudoalteromonas rhizosphaerae TaxID=2518973 RepID=UPI0021491C95|nr:hypothetical protein [Pseudoalteromonas rhizosphaerae]
MLNPSLNVMPTLPAQLPRVEVIVDLDEGEKVCGCCQSALHKMGESSSCVFSSALIT